MINCNHYFQISIDGYFRCIYCSEFQEVEQLNTVKEFKSKCGKHIILVDEEDYQRVMDFAPNGWEAKFTTGSNNPYATTRKTIDVGDKRVRKNYYLHRLVMNVLEIPDVIVDHKFTNTLDNRKNSLRLVTSRQNSKNRTSKKNSASKHLGVSYCTSAKRSSKKYRVFIKDMNIQKNNIHLGYYLDEESAGYAYNVAAQLVHGEYANLNQVNMELVMYPDDIKAFVLNKLDQTLNIKS